MNISMSISQKQSEVNWEKIDDHEFVYLCSDLLKGIGFTDLQINGDGPDGGLDLIATELVPFAIQGAQPFRWGIQCKFSKGGGKRSVNDTEIRDVTGILNSDRYIAHGLRGYMVMTNRRISQNVVERLAGINRRSDYKTAFVDNVRLFQMLLDDSRIIEKYFGKLKDRILDLGTPKQTLSKFDIQKGYEIDIEIQSFNKNKRKTIGVIDTGARITLIPEKIIYGLDLKPVGSPVQLMGLDGRVSAVFPYVSEIIMADLNLGIIKFFSWDKEIALIGRDILQNFTILLDGPKQEMKIF